MTLRKEVRQKKARTNQIEKEHMTFRKDVRPKKTRTNQIEKERMTLRKEGCKRHGRSKLRKKA